jgi:hypothetical protein
MPRVEKRYRAERQDEEAWKRLTDADLLPFLAEHPELATHPALREFAWLEMEFGR